jgi:hypothetical protein
MAIRVDGNREFSSLKRVSASVNTATLTKTVACAVYGPVIHHFAIDCDVVYELALDGGIGGAVDAVGSVGCRRDAARRADAAAHVAGAVH